MARVQSQQILDALDGMRNLNGNTDELLTTIQGLKTSNYYEMISININ